MQVRDNGAKVITNSDDYNPADQFAEMADSLFVITPVSSDAQRDALLKFPGRTIRRLDKSGSLEWWDGDRWIPDLISTIWTNGSNAVTTAGGGPGALTLDTVNSQNPAFITSPGPGQLQVVLAGAYAFAWHASGLGGTAGYMAVKNAPGSGTYALSNYPSAGENTVSTPNLYLAAGAIVTFVMGPSSNVTIASTIRATKMA